MKNKKMVTSLLIALLCVLGAIWNATQKEAAGPSAAVTDVPAFSQEPYVVINDNQPEFTDAEITDKAYEYYSELDAYNRCGYAMACVGQELMPTQERGSIGQVKPSGWQTVKYDFVDGKYLYNRSI